MNSFSNPMIDQCQIFAVLDHRTTDILDMGGFYAIIARPAIDSRLVANYPIVT